jgi:hypothetical protein
VYDASTPCLAFDGDRLLARGPLAEVARAVAAAADPAAVRVFVEETARPVDLDLRGTADAVVARLPPPPPEAPRGRGRPKLGVTPREVTLLPRHWDWLAAQPGGASVALRKLVEAAMRDPREEARAGREAAYRLLTVLAGDRPGYEEAMRALFAGDRAAFDRHTGGWPADALAWSLERARLA